MTNFIYDLSLPKREGEVSAEPTLHLLPRIPCPLEIIHDWWKQSEPEKLREWQGKMAAFLLGELGKRMDVSEVASLVLDDEGKADLAFRLAKASEFEQSVKVAEKIEDAWERSWALTRIAEAMAEEGMEERAKEVFEQAINLAESVPEAGKRYYALWWVAAEMARAGLGEQVKDLVLHRLTVGRSEKLPEVMEALVGRKDKETFFSLLPLCGWDLSLAYKACGWLAFLYPEQGAQIAMQVSRVA